MTISNLRDREANSARYLVLASGASSPSSEEELSHPLLEGDFPPTCSVLSSSIRVGDLVLLEKNQRVLADLILLRTPNAPTITPTNWMASISKKALRIYCNILHKFHYQHEK
ncbi:hypothetical protein F5888DRAFT_1805715 [Russula emetica]|nr:hypothetical protein F5888DRAFT_1805715 [Russula emetica]